MIPFEGLGTRIPDNKPLRFSFTLLADPWNQITGVGLFESLSRLLCFETFSKSFGNDPSAGSPTETLLRLLLPLDDQV